MTPSTLPHCNILVIDDTPINLTLLKNMLTEQGYDVRLAVSGEIALKAIEHMRPDLIVLDILMPDMDGYEVCRRLKANPETHDIPVVFMSALNETVNKVAAFEIGGVDYISKPFQAEEVVARVRTHLRLQEQARELKRAKDVAEAANQAKSEFLTSVSHELRTPLHAILGFAQVMARSGSLPAEHQENLHIILENGDHLLVLINQVLEVSRNGVECITLPAQDAGRQHLFDDLEAILRRRTEDAQSPEKADLNFAELSPALRQLPTDLVEQLRQAVKRSDVDLMDRLIADIRAYQPDAAEVLSDWADNFQYEQILQILQEVIQRS